MIEDKEMYLGNGCVSTKVTITPSQDRIAKMLMVRMEEINRLSKSASNENMLVKLEIVANTDTCCDRIKIKVYPAASVPEAPEHMINGD